MKLEKLCYAVSLFETNKGVKGCAVSFNRPPKVVVIDTLKKNKFKWLYENKVWFVENNDIEKVKSAIDKVMFKVYSKEYFEVEEEKVNTIEQVKETSLFDNLETEEVKKSATSKKKKAEEEEKINDLCSEKQRYSILKNNARRKEASYEFVYQKDKTQYSCLENGMALCVLNDDLVKEEKQLLIKQDNNIIENKFERLMSNINGAKASYQKVETATLFEYANVATAYEKNTNENDKTDMNKCDLVCVQVCDQVAYVKPTHLTNALKVAFRKARKEIEIGIVKNYFLVVKGGKNTAVVCLRDIASYKYDKSIIPTLKVGA